MSERIRFHLDENVDPAIAQALQRHDIDVTTTVSSGLRTSSDTTQLRFIQTEQRVIVTHDRDFLRMAGEGVSLLALPIVNWARALSAKLFAHCVLSTKCSRPLICKIVLNTFDHATNAAKSRSNAGRLAMMRS